MGREKYDGINFDQVGHDVHPLVVALIVVAMALPVVLTGLLILGALTGHGPSSE